MSAAPGLEVLTSTKIPAPAPAATASSGSSESAPSSGLSGRRIGAEARDLAPGSRRRAEEGVGVGGGADGDVAALAVGDDEQARIVSGARRPRSSARPARRAERLEAGELRLDRDAGGAGLAISSRHRVATASAARSRASEVDHPVRELAERQGSAVRDRIQSEADLAAALRDERRKPVREWFRATRGRFSCP